ncbi:YihY/virulence factor BrkB family protein [Siccirubricoccus sp. G192]|uniref:YihY/virulence factor BrkB family protein n=1 Tax=Siccirubricoccus sp. G192 TaxID=2849651 RepID=UPI001C2C58C2|nr:YihY/virulence factor BrkB family protein [Siccirubricoccus sp. G192]MBV1799424.1 YihY/virulence factor BrkB family protein [Siccirubricoccus sp. G192]
MPADRKPSALLATALAATGLLLASFGRRSAPARTESGHPSRGHGAQDRARAREPGRGRNADAPSEIPARGWWDILKRTAAEVSNDRVLTEAAGVTFYGLLALFPALAALISFYGLFAEPATISEHLATLSAVVPGGGMEIIEEQVKRITSKGGGTLGLSALIGLATSLWSANQASKAIVDALNVVYDERETRGFFRRLAITMAFTLGGILFILVAMLGVVVLPVVLQFVGLPSSAEWLLSLARWPVLLAAIGLFLAFLYRYGPNRDRAKWRWISWGSATAAVLWAIGSLGFSWYVSNFGNYNETYGSLGAVIGFMTWIWLSATIVLAGAELDAEMEHQTARDTTTGPERPMGTRGARMADTVAS